MLTVAVVLAVQCFLFGDGGASSLGANILNMAVAGTLVASAIYSMTTGYVAGTKGKLLGAGAAAFGSVLAATGLCSLELAASGTYGLADVMAIDDPAFTPRSADRRSASSPSAARGRRVPARNAHSLSRVA